MNGSPTLAISILLLLGVIFGPAVSQGQNSPAMHELSAAKPAALPLGLATQPVSVQIPLREEAPAKIAEAVAPASKIALLLDVTGLIYGRPDVHYEVYVNLPSDKEPDPESPYFVGNLAPFFPHGAGNEHPYNIKFDITKNIRELRSLSAWNDKQLSVTFVMRGLVDREGRPLPAPAGVRGRVNNLTVNVVSIQ